jgi:glycosyltransferase involved in cell wall biosynthesis
MNIFRKYSKTDYPEFEVIVVDDQSNDETLDVLKAFKKALFKYSDCLYRAGVTKEPGKACHHTRN